MGEVFKKLLSRNELFKAGKFLAGFAIIFGVLYITYPLYLLSIELLYAYAINAVLLLFGRSGEILVQEPVLILLGNLTVQISFLCTGLIELFVLVAGIASSFGIEFRKRPWGIIGSFAVVFVFNLLRILIMILLLWNLSIEVVDFAHDFLFRATLFIVVVGYYSFWFYYATNKKFEEKIKKFFKIE